MAHWAKLWWTLALNHTCSWVVVHQQSTKKNFHFCYVRLIHPWAINWWKLVSLCRAEKLKGWGDVLALVAKGAAGFDASCLIFRFRRLSPEDEPRCWSSPTWMPAPCSTLPPPPPRWPPSYPPTLSGSTYSTRSNLTGKVLFLTTFFQNKESSIESWKFWELCNFKVKVWPSWPTLWKPSTTQIPFSFQFSALSVDNIQLMMARPKGLS